VLPRGYWEAIRYTSHMSVRLAIRHNGHQRDITVDLLPDSCPHCHYAGEQIRIQGESVVVKEYSAARVHIVYVGMKCSAPRA
jgi:hypothetical protein